MCGIGVEVILMDPGTFLERQSWFSNPRREIIGLDQEQGVPENKKDLHRAGSRA